MPVLETDFLKGLLDENDRLHKHCVRALAKVGEDGWAVASSSMLELDLLLKNAGISQIERHDAFASLRTEVAVEALLPVSHAVLSEAALLQNRYSFTKFYFDSVHIATAILHDGQIVSSDREFDKVSEIKRVPLDRL